VPAYQQQQVLSHARHRHDCSDRPNSEPPLWTAKQLLGDNGTPNNAHCQRRADRYHNTTPRRFSLAFLSRDAVGNESVPTQLAQCWFPWLAISNAKI